MAQVEIKSKDGKVVGSVEVKDSLAKAEVKRHLLHAAVTTEEANSRQGTSKTKTRSEVRGGGKKPYKQKKTGNARQGTRRAPHFAHGGMAFALTPRDYTKKLNRKERRQAILGAIAGKLQEGNLVVTDQIVFAEPKTSQATGLLKALGLDTVKRILVVLPAYDEVTYKCFRNLPNVEVRTAPAKSTEGESVKTAVFSARDVVVAHKVLIAKEALAQVEEVWAS